MALDTVGMKVLTEIECDKEGCSAKELIQTELGQEPGAFCPQKWQLIIRPVNEHANNYWHYCPLHHLPHKHGE